MENLEDEINKAFNLQGMKEMTSLESWMLQKFLRKVGREKDQEKNES